MNTHRHSPIGIDVQPASIRAAQLVPARGGARGEWRLSASATVPRDPAASDLAADARRLAGVLSRQNFAGREIVLAVPDDKLLASTLELPPRSCGAPLEQLAAAEISRIHKREPGSLELALWDVPAPVRTGGASPYMAVACLHEDAEALLGAFESAGLGVRALDVRPLAVTRACSTLLQPPPAMNALLHVGWASCTLWIVIGAAVAYERQLEAAEIRRLVDMLSASTGVTPAAAEGILRDAADDSGEDSDRHREAAILARDAVTAHLSALTEQLRISLSYAARRYSEHKLGRLLLLGDFGLLPALASRAGTLGVEIQPVRPADFVQIPDAMTRAGADGGLVTAIGLARYTEGAAP